MLKHWKQGKGSSATYRTLCDALKHALVQRKDLALRFCYINRKYFPLNAVTVGVLMVRCDDIL